MADDLIEQEESGGLSISPKSGNGFSPFYEVVDHNYDVVVSISRSGIACDEVYSPFRERTNGDNQMKRGRMGVHFLHENMTQMELLDYCDAVFKQSGPIVSYT